MYHRGRNTFCPQHHHNLKKGAGKMFERGKIESLEDYFNPLGNRPGSYCYFYRINGYSGEIRTFIQKYYDAARKSGVVIEGKIQNPTEQNLAYYGEMMGMAFQMDLDFIQTGLKKWLPRMNENQRLNVSASIYSLLCFMQAEGKTENILKNAYIKFMCWLYYRFERVVSQLGGENIPKILYEGEISRYELLLISILAGAGCDVVLLQYHGDEAYGKLDPYDQYSEALWMDGMQAFPQEFNLRTLREAVQQVANKERLYGQRPQRTNRTNAWISGDVFQDILSEPIIRGTAADAFFNCYYRINGVEDKAYYASGLYQFHMELKNLGRRVVIVNGSIPKPMPDEIAKIRRSHYGTKEQLVQDLGSNIQYPANLELQKIMKKAFVDVLFMEEGELNKLMNRAVYLLCWLRRYQHDLFADWKAPEISCFIQMGGCKNENEAMFLKFLARLPVDVLILAPDLYERCCLKDPLLREATHVNSMKLEKFPDENTQIRIGTAGFHAEREMEMMLGGGSFRSTPCSKANAVNLQTMYEEIWVLWEQELKYRPGFSSVNGVANIPVLFARISGIPDGNVKAYWLEVKKLMTPDTVVISSVPYLKSSDANPVKNVATHFYQNGTLLRERIKNHSTYPYGYLREEIQEHILDKLELMIAQNIIRGTRENGVVYTIISTVLHMRKDILRLLQRFDFEGKNPKLLFINTREASASLEDSILTAFLNMVGFDIVFFVPTGYQVVEKNFTRPLVEEYRVGEYKYDLPLPNFNRLTPEGEGESLGDKIRRGLGLMASRRRDG